METIDVSELDAVWFDDPTKYDYVRKVNSIAGHPKYKGNFPRDWKLIGYTKPNHLGKKIFKKFLFWLKPYDRGMPKEKEVYGASDLKRRFGNSWKFYRPCEAIKITNKEKRTLEFLKR